MSGHPIPRLHWFVQVRSTLLLEIISDGSTMGLTWPPLYRHRAPARNLQCARRSKPGPPTIQSRPGIQPRRHQALECRLGIYLFGRKVCSPAEPRGHFQRVAVRVLDLPTHLPTEEGGVGTEHGEG